MDEGVYGAISAHLDQLQSRFGDSVSELQTVSENEVRLKVPPERWEEIVRFFQSDPAWRMDYPADLAVWDTGEQLSLMLRLWSSTLNLNALLFTDINRENPAVASLTPLYPGLNWHEREMYDLYGVVFEGHPDLKRILMPEDWDGFPFRRDYEPVFSGDPLHGPQETN